MSYEALVFDFFGVVCTDVAPLWFAERFPEGEREALKEQYVHPADIGVESQEELLTELAGLSGDTPAEIITNWQRRAKLDTGLLAFIKELHESRKIGLLSNAPSPFFRSLLERGGVADLFDAIVVSSEVGHAKPEPEIFHVILERLGVAPEKALMIDDNAANVDGAIAVGMGGYPFTSVQALKDKLA